jgi:plasmid stabilization system protein ParE
MVKKRLKVIWDNEAKQSLKSIYYYIKQRESQAQAVRVRKKIVELAKSLSSFPEKFAEEPNLKSQKGNYRFKTIWSYKIIYEVTSEAILVLDIFHTIRNPKTISELTDD